MTDSDPKTDLPPNDPFVDTLRRAFEILSEPRPERPLSLADPVACRERWLKEAINACSKVSDQIPENVDETEVPMNGGTCVKLEPERLSESHIPGHTLATVRPQRSYFKSKRVVQLAIGSLAAIVLIAIGAAVHFRLSPRPGAKPGEDYVKRDPRKSSGNWNPQDAVTKDPRDGVEDHQGFRLEFAVGPGSGRKSLVLIGIDASGAELLGQFEAKPDGSFEGVVPGRFKTSPGWELAVVILCDDPRALSNISAFILPSALEAMQDAPEADRERVVRDILSAALKEYTGWSGSPEEINLVASIRHK